MRRVQRSFCVVAIALLAPWALAASPPFSVSSPDFRPHHPIPDSQLLNQYGCSGQNRSPALRWQNAPSGTKSFALTLFDLDEHGTPSGWWHWVVYDIPGTTTGLPENAGSEHSVSLPAGAIQGRTDLSQDAYHGPCPGKGEPPHRYVITVYALSVDRLPVPAEASGAMVSWVAHEYTLAKATLTVRYGR